MIRLSMYILQMPSFLDLSNPGIAQGALAVVKKNLSPLAVIQDEISMLKIRMEVFINPFTSQIFLALNVQGKKVKDLQYADLVHR